ncbi:MAG: hypothetical protein ACREUV_09405, partial [Burkholderiales bacterium]
LYTVIIGGNIMRNSPLEIRPLFALAVVSVIFFSVLGIAAITGRIPVMNSLSSEPAAGSGGSGIQPGIMPIEETRASARRMGQAKPCTNCGIVDSIMMNKTKRDDGAANGASAGQKIGYDIKAVTHQVKIRMDNGTYRAVLQQGRPVFHVGDKVRIINGEIIQIEKARTADNHGMFGLMLGAFTNRLF